MNFTVQSIRHHYFHYFFISVLWRSELDVYSSHAVHVVCFFPHSAYHHACVSTVRNFYVIHLKFPGVCSRGILGILYLILYFQGKDKIPQSFMKFYMILFKLFQGGILLFIRTSLIILCSYIFYRTLETVLLFVCVFCLLLPTILFSIFHKMEVRIKTIPILYFERMNID